MSTINEESTVEEILKKEGAAEILERHHFPCLHCPMAKYEIAQLKLGEVCQTYGLDLKKILEELNGLK